MEDKIIDNKIVPCAKTYTKLKYFKNMTLPSKDGIDAI